MSAQPLLGPDVDVMKKLFGVCGALVLAGLAYFCLWPIPIEPVSWDAPAAPGYAGPHAVNDKPVSYTHLDVYKRQFKEAGVP